MKGKGSVPLRKERGRKGSVPLILNLLTWPGKKSTSRPYTPRLLLSQYPGAIYHVMKQGDRCELILHDDGDRERFLDAMDVRQDLLQVHAVAAEPDFVPTN